MKNLQARLDRIEGLKREIAECQRIYAGAKAKISQVAQSGSFGELGKLNEVATMHALAPERIDKLEADLVCADEELRDELRRVRDTWNAFVGFKADELFDTFIARINPFFGGKEKERITRTTFGGLHIPAVAEIQRRYVELGDYWKFKLDDRVKLAKRLMERIEASCKEHGWKFDEREIPAKKSEPAKVPSKVQVRALQAMPGEPFGKKPTLQRGKPVPPIIKEGEVLTIDYKDYHVLSRYFERLDKGE